MEQPLLVIIDHDAERVVLNW